MSIDAQVDADFTRVRRRSFVRRMGARLRGDTASTGLLLSFEEVRKALVPASASISPAMPFFLEVARLWKVFSSLSRSMRSGDATKIRNGNGHRPSRPAVVSEDLEGSKNFSPFLRILQAF